MVLRLLQKALCLWVIFAVGKSGFDFCLYMAKSFPESSWLITWSGGIASCMIGIFAGMAAWRGFGFKEY
ncbi:hypothetical protein HUC42_06005 [Escherichia coli]|uniref:hypothetical protein n=1 Tax=Escherichia coli TaxID=562 RepID=UPI00157C4A95|nr:hypothetical protein [Escherichia coli]NUD79471.1 hypothetical protein [Escherichia coli]